MEMTTNGTKRTRRELIPLPRFYLIESRYRAGLSVEEVSRKLNISHYYYYQIESGRRGHKLPIKTALDLIRVLDMDPIKFLESESEHVNKRLEINRDV
jgi:transcriptional regulator with XRE-family HTH domain